MNPARSYEKGRNIKLGQNTRFAIVCYIALFNNFLRDENQ